MPETQDIGCISPQRYEEIVAELREVVQQQTTGQFTIGDRALEVEPIGVWGGRQAAAPGEELFTVRQSLFRLTEDVGLSYSTVDKDRWTASRWPAAHRQPEGCSGNGRDASRYRTRSLTVPHTRVKGNQRRSARFLEEGAS